MSMQERPDDEAANEGLDRLFRKSAEEFEPPYEPVAWQLMSAKLDERDRITVWGRVLRGTLAVMALIVFFSGSWYIYKQNKVNTPLTDLKAVQPAIVHSASGVQRMPGKRSIDQQQSTNPESLAGSANEAIVEASVTGTSRRIQSEQSSTTESVAEEKLPGSKNNLPKPVALQSQQEIAGRHIDNQPMEIETSQRRRLSWPVVRQHSSPDQTKKNSNKSALRSTATGELESPASIKNGSESVLGPLAEVQGRKSERVVAVNRPSEVNRAGQTDEMAGYTSTNKTTADAFVGDSAMFTSELSRIGPLDALSNRDVMRWPQWSTLTIPALALPQAEPTAEKTAKPIRERGLSIRLVLSPDLSAVGVKNFTRPGKNYGLLLEYRISSRFSVQAGVIQSKKIYTATPEQYAWPTNWQWYVKPVGVDGRCNMLDIPVNLRYDFLRIPTGSGGLSANRRPARWFVSSGVTTYIMQQETYDYVYEDPTNQWIKYRSLSAKTGRYNFSNLNLSAGYERPLGRRFALQIEPFLKVPLKEVGYFKINLLSTGAFLSLRYQL